jgi:hypothetical protein
MAAQRLHLHIETASVADISCAMLAWAWLRDVDIITAGRPFLLHAQFTTLSHTMAMRQAVVRPLGAVARSTGCSRAAMRTFASTALRAKEVAGQDKDTPNMRVRFMRQNRMAQY